MCKIIVFSKAPLPNSPKRQRKLFSTLLDELGKSQKDGLGIAWVDGIGIVHRRRWASPEDFKEFLEDDCRAPFALTTSDPPDPEPAQGFVLLHGRTATSEKGLRNAHPHMLTDPAGTTFALIHNGVVNASEPDKARLGQLLSGCDSELILAAFAAGGMERVNQIITGYYAFAVIVANADGTSFLHVVRDGTTSLYVGELSDKSYVFATTEDLIKLAGAKVYAKCNPLMHVTFDNMGVLMDMEDIPGPKSSYSYSPPAPVPAPWPASSHLQDSPVICLPASMAATPLPTRTSAIDRNPHMVRVIRGKEETNDDYWTRYCQENGLDDEGAPLERPPLIQGELTIGLNPDLAVIDSKIAIAEGKKSKLENIEPVNDANLMEIEGKIMKCEARILRLREMKRQAVNAGAMAAFKAEEAAGLPGLAAALIQAEREVSGVGETHSVPIGQDAIAALEEALVQAERVVSGVAPLDPQITI